jgi:probable rRNA maturation factor
LDCPDAELSILIVNDQQIAKLNQQFLNRKGPTNVIAFPMQEGQFTAETARHEAHNAGLRMEEHLNELLIHGILHLLGYDHGEKKSEARVMQNKTNELLKIIKKEVV